MPEDDRAGHVHLLARLGQQRVEGDVAVRPLRLDPPKFVHWPQVAEAAVGTDEILGARYGGDGAGGDHGVNVCCPRLTMTHLPRPGGS